MIHLLQRTLLKCDLPAVPRTDDASIDDEIAAGTLETCADGDSLSGLEKGFDQNPQTVGEWDQAASLASVVEVVRSLRSVRAASTTCACRSAGSVRLPRLASRSAFEDTCDGLGCFRFVKSVLDSSWHASLGRLVEVKSVVSEPARCGKELVVTGSDRSAIGQVFQRPGGRELLPARIV